MAGRSRRSLSSSRSRSRSRSRSYDSSDSENPGNNLYVTGLSTRVTKKELEKHFSSEGGTVVETHLVVDPRTRESRGFGFVTMSTNSEADRCVKYLNHSVLGGRVITVEKVPSCKTKARQNSNTWAISGCTDRQSEAPVSKLFTLWPYWL
ncbi:Serine/arginine-rich splicing factor [Nymphaea thermarum]|nr:Serine/arginine-rich splicing factor [Nymphaea thermarum]